MKLPKKICLDLDDTLCGLVDAWNSWLHDMGHTPRLLTRSDIVTYDFYSRHFNDSVFDFYKKLNCYEEWVEPIIGSHLFLEWCEQEFDEVMILSYATSEKCKKDKTAFVKKHYNIDNIHFFSSSKEKYKFTQGYILVDDYPMNVLPHVINNKNLGIIFNLDNENGWSNPTNYREMVNQMGINDIENVRVCHSYDHIKDIINLKRKYE